MRKLLLSLTVLLSVFGSAHAMFVPTRAPVVLDRWIDWNRASYLQHGQMYGLIGGGVSINTLRNLQATNQITVPATPVQLMQTKVIDQEAGTLDAAIGYFLPWSWTPIQLEAEYTLNGALNYNPTQLVASGIDRFNSRAYTHAWFGNAYFEPIIIKSMILPYVGGGAGVSLTETKGFLGTNNNVGYGETSRFAWQAVAGFMIVINQNWLFDLGYRYRDFGGISYGTTSNGTNAYNIRSQHYKSQAVMVRIGFNLRPFSFL